MKQQGHSNENDSADTETNKTSANRQLYAQNITG